MSIPVPGGSIEILANEPSTSAPPTGAAPRRARSSQAEIERAERKLANEGFVAKAPRDVVAAEREKLERLQAELDAL